MSGDPNEQAKRTSNEEDYYYEGEYLVFTEAFHKKRGYCCESACRHCPWSKKEDASANDKSAN